MPLLPNNTYADTRNAFRNNLEFLVSFDDSLWSEWEPYDTNDDTRRISLPDQLQTEPDPFNGGQERKIFYAFAMQVRDTAGAVSIGRTYGTSRWPTWASPRACRPPCGSSSASSASTRARASTCSPTSTSPPARSWNFSWTADASDYAGEIVSYRYGWDVSDVFDPNDPNWALLPGNSAQHRRSQPISFAQGRTRSPCR